MRDLLDMSSQRIISILDTVLIHDDWITVSELSAIIGASERTISDDIDTLRKRWDTYLNIEVSTKKGIKINNKTPAIIGNIFIDIFNDSTALKWLEEILFYPNNNIEFYEKKLFVSRSTLIRMLPRINNFLSKIDMIVKNKLNSYSIISSNEQNLRQFYTCFLIELYGLDFKKFNLDLDIRVLIKIVSSIFDHNLDIHSKAFVLNDDIAILYYPVFYVISLIREYQGYHIDSNHDISGEITPEELSYIQRFFPSITERNLSPIHELIVKYHNGWDSDNEKKLITSEIKRFFERVLNKTNLHPDSHTLQNLYFIIRSLYFTAKVRPFKTSNLFDRIYYFSISLKRNNSFLYHLIEENLKILSDHISFDMSNKFYDLLFWVCLYYPDLNNYVLAKTALIISDFGMQHTKFLADLVSGFFNKPGSDVLHVTAVSLPYDIDALPKEECDLIITTIPNLPTCRKDVILISDYPSHDDLCSIYKAIHQYDLPMDESPAKG